uniref:Uncharacterized protein n=1 Tax=Anguilla anguilla TaxID=7936 RepID=A0A0E9WP47_ANGAN
MSQCRPNAASSFPFPLLILSFPTAFYSFLIPSFLHNYEAVCQRTSNLVFLFPLSVSHAELVAMLPSPAAF